MKAPRVLVSGLALAQPMGGVWRHNAELLPRAARILSDAGGGMAVVLSRAGTGIELGAPIEILSSGAPAGPALPRALAEGRVLRAALRAASARGRPFDLVHTGHLPAPGKLAVPWTLTLHDLRALSSTAPVLRRLLAPYVLARAVERAAAVITVSASVRAEIEARHAPRRTFVVPNAGDHLPVLPRAPAPGAPLLALGHVERRKNLELVLRALAHDAALPSLLVVGASKAREEERLTRLASELGVAGRLGFLGPVSDARLPELYASCAAVVLASRLEGFGIGVLEAQRAQAPLAVARIDALVEVAGPLVPTFAPDDPGQCARAIRTALGQSAAQLASLAAGADRYRWQASAEALVAAWRAVLLG